MLKSGVSHPITIFRDVSSVRPLTQLTTNPNLGDMMRTFLVHCSCLIFFAAAFSSSAQEERQPNVVLILIDDLGVMDTELRDDSFYETPHILELARRGMRFTNGYCAHPRCVPSRYAIQSGRFPCRDAMNTGSPDKFLKKHKTIGEAFQEQGYATFFTGKWHLGKEETTWPHHRGYDVNIGGCHAGAPGSYFFPFHIARKTGKTDKYGPLYRLEEGEKDEHLSDRITRETERWIRSRVKADDGKPFFAFLSHYAVHTPIEGKGDEVAYFKKKAGRIPEVEGAAYQPVDGQTKVRRDSAEYASMIKTMDESVGRVLTLLDELDIAENTVVALTSDHGGLSNRGAESNRDVATSNLPYRAGKGHLYEGGLRVPFLIAYPKKVKPGSVSEVVALGTDLYPTLLDLAGLGLLPKEHADGISLRSALAGGEQEREKPVIWHSPLPRPGQTGDEAASSIRVRDFKLVKRYFPESVEFYDLEADPYEEKNLAEERPDEVAKMKGRLERTLVRYGSMPPRKDWKDPTVTAPLSGG